MKRFRLLTILVCLVLAICLSSCLPAATPTPVLDITIEKVTAEVGEAEMASYDAEVKRLAKGKTLVEIYEIRLMKDGKPMQPEGNVTVKIALSDEQKALSGLQVIHISDAGAVTLIPSKQEGGFILFDTDRFSSFGLIADAAAPTASTTPDATSSITPAPTGTIAPTPTPSAAPTASRAPTPSPTTAPTPSLLTEAGDVVTFGKYEQDNNLSNGKERITWRVLAVSGGKALLLSDKNLDAQPYNDTYAFVTWATCSLRTWLNAEFISAAFNASEASAIMMTSVANPDNPTYGTAGGDATNDKVFLLSIGEANEYFSTDASRISFNTPFSKAQGAYDEAGASWWWLRSPGDDYSSFAAGVNIFGTVSDGGSSVFPAPCAVRPALWVILGS
jgi:hypothetical protein